MTDEAQRIAIAKECGWKLVPAIVGKYWRHPTNPLSDGRLPPDYLHDLNACYELEAAMQPEVFRKYVDEICHRYSDDVGDPEISWLIHLTARNRCECFLRALNKWTNDL